MFQPHNKSNINIQELPDSAVSTTLSCFNIDARLQSVATGEFHFSFHVSRLEFSLSESHDRIKVNWQVRIILYMKRELWYLVFWFFRFLVTLEICFRLKEFPHIFSSDFLFFSGLFVFLLFFSPFCHSLFAFMNSKKYFGFTYSPWGFWTVML